MPSQRVHSSGRAAALIPLLFVLNAYSQIGLSLCLCASCRTLKLVVGLVEEVPASVRNCAGQERLFSGSFESSVGLRLGELCIMSRVPMQGLGKQS